MTDTNESPSEPVEATPATLAEREPAEMSSVEREVLEDLRKAGIAIVLEEPEHRIGNMTRYLIVGRRGIEESDPTIEALGGTRLNALRALKVQALSS